VVEAPSALPHVPCLTVMAPRLRVFKLPALGFKASLTSPPLNEVDHSYIIEPGTPWPRGFRGWGVWANRLTFTMLIKLSFK